MTLWEFRKVLGSYVSRVYKDDKSSEYDQESPIHPCLIRIYRYAGCIDLKESDNGKTLAELHFKPNEQITVYKRNMFSVPKVPLIING